MARDELKHLDEGSVLQIWLGELYWSKRQTELWKQIWGFEEKFHSNVIVSSYNPSYLWIKLAYIYRNTHTCTYMQALR